MAASDRHDSAGEAAGDSANWPTDSPYRPPAAYDAPPPAFIGDASAAALGPRRWPQPQPLVGFLAALGFVLFQLVLGVPVAFIALAIWGLRFLQVPEAQWMMIVVGTGTSMLGSLATMPLVYGRAAWRAIGMRLPSARDALLVALWFLPLAIVVSELNNILAHFIPPIGMEFMGQLGEMPLPLLVLGACIFPAVGEEIFFRGFIGRGLVGKWGPVAGVLVTSILFGAVHLVPLQALSAIVLGVALHFVYLTTKSLAAPILLHFLNNLLATVAMRYSAEWPVPGLSDVDETQWISTPPLMLLVSLALVAGIGALFYAGRTRWQTPAGEPYDFGYVTGEIPPGENAPRGLPLHWAWLMLAVAGIGLFVYQVVDSITLSPA